MFTTSSSQGLVQYNPLDSVDFLQKEIEIDKAVYLFESIPTGKNVWESGVRLSIEHEGELIKPGIIGIWANGKEGNKPLYKVFYQDVPDSLVRFIFPLETKKSKLNLEKDSLLPSLKEEVLLIPSVLLFDYLEWRRNNFYGEMMYWQNYSKVSYTEQDIEKGGHFGMRRAIESRKCYDYLSKELKDLSHRRHNLPEGVEKGTKERTREIIY